MKGVKAETKYVLAVDTVASIAVTANTVIGTADLEDDEDNDPERQGFMSVASLDGIG